MSDNTVAATASGSFPAMNGSRMYAMKGLRKQTEQDVITLQNRIERLKAENERANKRIQETTKRTNDIVANKKRDALKEEERQAAAAAAADERRRATQAHFIKRSQDKETRNVKRDAMRASKKDMAAATKAEREQNEAYIRDRAAAMKQQNQESFYSVRKSEMQARMRQNSQKEKFEGALTSVRTKQMEEEEKQMISNQSKVEELERQEAALIEELKQRTSKQMEAYQNLREACLVSSPEEFKNVYMGTLSNPASPRLQKTAASTDAAPAADAPAE